MSTKAYETIVGVTHTHTHTHTHVEPKNSLGLVDAPQNRIDNKEKITNQKVSLYQKSDIG